MPDDFLVLNIKEYLQRGERGEHLLRRIFSTFSCKKKNGFKRFALRRAKTENGEAYPLLRLLKVL